ncbi:hypothetical protein ACFV4F_29240 [Kitasatospora sp. NPDC059722]|uniref:hypothetical protein n=1 Tax=unclassified Kitasatospora TaxID=2633591 RepID=UPI0036C5C4D7
MVHGPAAGLALLSELEADRRPPRHHRPFAVRGHLLELLELLGQSAEAAAAYREAAARTVSAPERRYLAERAGRVAS